MRQFHACGIDIEFAIGIFKLTCRHFHFGLNPAQMCYGILYIKPQARTPFQQHILFAFIMTSRSREGQLAGTHIGHTAHSCHQLIGIDSGAQAFCFIRHRNAALRRSYLSRDRVVSCGEVLHIERTR